MTPYFKNVDVTTIHLKILFYRYIWLWTWKKCRASTPKPRMERNLSRYWNKDARATASIIYWFTKFYFSKVSRTWFTVEMSCFHIRGRYKTCIVEKSENAHEYFTYGKLNQKRAIPLTPMSPKIFTRKQMIRHSRFLTNLLSLNLLLPLCIFRTNIFTI